MKSKYLKNIKNLTVLEHVVHTKVESMVFVIINGSEFIKFRFISCAFAAPYPLYPLFSYSWWCTLLGNQHENPCKPLVHRLEA